MNLLLKSLVILFTIIAAYILIGIATIIKNGTSITAKPGTSERLKTFFTTHLAETKTNSPYPELQAIQYSIQENSSSDNIVKQIIDSAESLGYSLEEKTDKQLHFVITTKTFKFKDDVLVFVEIDNGYLTINARSESRVGRADFGANIANISRLFKEVDKRLQ